MVVPRRRSHIGARVDLRVEIAPLSTQGWRPRGATLALGLPDGSPRESPKRKEPRVDLKLEVVPIPVADVDMAKTFYTEQVGFRLDHDVRPNEQMRVVQMTPPGSACSVVIGEGLPLGEPGSLKGVQLVVEDIDAVREELAGRGVGVSEVQQLGPQGSPGSRFMFFQDPDGNGWAVQELKRS
jgi:catechol 2,3-dioxygenase-like lactoylglutathione lyase family enzyme